METSMLSSTSKCIIICTNCNTSVFFQVLAEMTNGGVDRSIECTGNINAMISAFECVHDDAEFKTHPVNFLNERTLKGTFFGNYKPRSDIPGVVEKYMNK
ncbi:hypothetical protein GW17_00036711, partial [Ensete ventricosum]